MDDTPWDRAHCCPRYHFYRGRELVVCYVDCTRCYSIVEGLLIEVASLMLELPVSVRGAGGWGNLLL